MVINNIQTCIVLSWRDTHCLCKQIIKVHVVFENKNIVSSGQTEIADQVQQKRTMQADKET